MPFLERKVANDTAISAWVVKQVPLDHGIEVRGMFNALGAAEKSDPHGVASKIVEIMAQARDPLEELKAGSLAEFVGLTTTEEPGGRRPSGMQTGDQPGRGQPGRGRARTRHWRVGRRGRQRCIRPSQSLLDRAAAWTDVFDWASAAVRASGPCGGGLLALKVLIKS